MILDRPKVGGPGLILALFLSIPSTYGDIAPTNAKDPKAVEEVLSGERRVANAAWWGFDDEDSTQAIQSAIDSGARRVIIPNMTKDWIVRPMTLRGDQELYIEEGAVITAKRGEFRGKGDTVFTARDVSNLTIIGYGATIRMQKEDYIVGKVLVDFDWRRWFGQYEKAEWRTGLSLRGCRKVKVYGLTIRDTGGDGIYVAGGGGRNFCEDIYLKDVVCDNNYRQGISIIGVDGFLAEDCEFKNTWGTPPSSGVDIEPGGPEEKVTNVVFKDCSFKDNYGDGIEVFLTHLSSETEDVSILFEDCRVTSKRGPGVRVSKVRDDGPGGLIEFKNCTVENTEGYGIKVQDKSADRARVRFVQCSLRNVANNRNFEGAWAPIWLHLFKSEITTKLGGVDFEDCLVEDDHDREVVKLEESEGEYGIFDLTGRIGVRNPHGVKTDLGEKQDDVTLVVEETGW